MAYGILLFLGHLGRGHAEFGHVEDRIVAKSAVTHGLLVQNTADFAPHGKFRSVRSYDSDAADELCSALLFRDVFQHLEDLCKLLRVSGILTAESCRIDSRSAVERVDAKTGVICHYISAFCKSVYGTSLYQSVLFESLAVLNDVGIKALLLHCRNDKRRAVQYLCDLSCLVLVGCRKNEFEFRHISLHALGYIFLAVCPLILAKPSG